MTFTFSRLSAGVYEVQKNSETVGFIRKSTATKWIVTDVVDTPQHVSKTLRDAKDACINLIIFDTDKEEVLVETVNNELNTKVEGSLNFHTVGNPYAVPTLDPMIF